MDRKATAYPLHWPFGWERTQKKLPSRFKTSVSGALNNVSDELRRFANDTGRKIENVLISSNVTLGDQKPADPGVAVYFRWDNMDACIPVDRYVTPAENLQAIARIIEAERTKLRHGGLNIVRGTFRGYTALPPPRGAAGAITSPWWEVLGFSSEGEATLSDAERSYRRLVKEHHPDKGGDPGRFNEIAEAIRQAREQLAA